VTLLTAVLAPAAFEGAPPLRFHLACLARHTDVGGRAPGSLAVADRRTGPELPAAEEPVVAMGDKYGGPRPAPVGPPLTLEDEGGPIAAQPFTEDAAERLAGSSRLPGDRRLDLSAQRAALEAGRTVLVALCRRHGAEAVQAGGAQLRAAAARELSAALAAIPAGAFAFADSLDDDAAGRQELGLRVHLSSDGRGALRVDFSDSDDQTGGALNTTRAVTGAAVSHALGLLCPNGSPPGDLAGGPIELLAPAGSLLDARAPRAVAGGALETALRIVDVVRGALAQALPGRVPAAGGGTRSTLAFGGTSPAPFVRVESLPGGAGGGPHARGHHGRPGALAGALTSVEELERAAPVRVLRQALRRASGGLGQHDGGDGVERALEFLVPVTVTLLGERRRRPPYGLRGGGPGQLGRDTLERAGHAVLLPAKCTFEAAAGDVLTQQTPGGGAWGDPRRKTP